MANKQNFKPDEWTKILESTMLAGMAVSAAEPSGLWGALKEALPAVQRWLQRSRMPGLTNSLRPSSRSSKQRKEDPPFRKHCASTSPAPLSLLTLFSVRSRICGRCQLSSMPRLPKTRLDLRPGYRPSARTWPRPLRRAVSSASEACKSATLRRPLWRTYQRLLERGPESGRSLHTLRGSPAILLALERRQRAARASSSCLRVDRTPQPPCAALKRSNTS